MPPPPQDTNSTDDGSDSYFAKNKKRWGVLITPEELSKVFDEFREQQATFAADIFAPEPPTSISGISNAESCLPHQPHEAELAHPVSSPSSHCEFVNNCTPDTASTTPPTSPTTFYQDASIASTPQDEHFKSYFSDSSVSSLSPGRGPSDDSRAITPGAAQYSNPHIDVSDDDTTSSPSLSHRERPANDSSSLDPWEPKVSSSPHYMSPHEPDHTDRPGAYIFPPVFSRRARVVTIRKRPLPPVLPSSELGPAMRGEPHDACSGNTPETRPERQTAVPAQGLDSMDLARQAAKRN